MRAQLLFAGNIVARQLLGPKKVAPYVPDFSLAFKHICIHTGAPRGRRLARAHTH